MTGKEAKVIHTSQDLETQRPSIIFMTWMVYECVCVCVCVCVLHIDHVFTMIHHGNIMTFFVKLLMLSKKTSQLSSKCQEKSLLARSAFFFLRKKLLK